MREICLSVLLTFTPGFALAGTIVTGLGSGGAPQVALFDSTTSLQFSSFLAYGSGFAGGVRVAVGDVNGDGVPDVVTGAGPGGGSQVKVFDGTTGAVLRSFLAFDAAFTGGVFVAAGDVTGDGLADIIVGADSGGAPHVKVFDAVTGATVRSFFAYDGAFSGGVRVAVGDLDGDSNMDIITGTGPGGGPHVKAFSGQTSAEIRSFFAYAPAFTGGVFVAAGDITGDGLDDIVTGADAGGAPHVKAFDGATLAEIRSFFAEDPGFVGGVRVAAADVNADGFADIITGAGPGGAPQVSTFDGVTGVRLGSFLATAPSFAGGVYVAATAFTAADTTAPVISVPASITVDATSPAGALVTFTATATDPDDAAGPVTCSPESGTTFPIGKTTVVCQATDSHGNTGSASFVVTVRAPVESLQILIATVGLDFPQAVNLLENALRRANAGQTSAACDALDAFLNQVAAQAGKSLSIADALQLTLQGAGVQAALGCSSPSP